ncbi:hypothetical protein [Sinomicrobium soli]|uniref:hypothetical protein n=1 Tax=Sinomicrobium sp. N-1-3-6 TaxID=2219864 RepID=UPI000DCD6241|nr:hypothetical protein [Sinomicrobium sp. N-1-3-6]RAV27467.1 hypothetical protein DN748_18520 [Sinomicrobium sp. N-1-3-6]
MIAFLAILTACSPEDGKDGIDGINGEQGIQGEPGQDGNANVVSRTFRFSQITWTRTTLFGTNYAVANLDIPEITRDIIDNGVVMVYGGFFWGQPWSALPISYNETGKTVNFSYGIATGGVTLRMHYADNDSPTFPGIPFRVVVIEGNAATDGDENRISNNNGGDAKESVYRELEQAGVDINNYNAIAKYYNLQD